MTRELNKAIWLKKHITLLASVITMQMRQRLVIYLFYPTRLINSIRKNTNVRSSIYKTSLRHELIMDILLADLNMLYFLYHSSGWNQHIAFYKRFQREFTLNLYQWLFNAS